MSEQTALEILRSNEKQDCQSVRNVDIYFNTTKNLSPTRRRCVDNFLIGWLSGDISAEKWQQALEYALKASEKYE